MKLKIHLFDGRLTGRQQLIVTLWSLALASMVALWAPRGIGLLTSGPDGFFLSIAQILGLLATFFALTQFMLMGRILWIERSFGLDRLASYHRLNGYMAITLILLHPIFITLHHMVEDSTDFVHAYLNIFSEHPYTLLALIAEILFLTVVGSSIYISRKHLKFETWYFVHLMVYLAIVLVPFHQFVNGSSFAGSDLATAYWFGVYAFVALNLLIWRFGLLIYNFYRFDFRISRVVHETPTVTSVYIKAKNVERLKVHPGQFILVRIFTRKLWWQEHPFTVSWIPHGDELRISVRNVGDYTADIQRLKPGARLFVSGPFGRFTGEVASTKKRLFIAGGIGITPIRALGEEAREGGLDSILLYANKTLSDVPLKKEINALNSLGFKTVYVYSDEKVHSAEYGRVDSVLVKRVVPDFKQRDIYLCGPPPMMAGLVEQLQILGVDPERLHYERFALHNR